MRRNQSAAQKHTHQFFDFCDVQVKKARVDNDPLELEDVLRMGFQNGEAVGLQEHRRIARAGSIFMRLIFGLGSSCDFIMHTHNQGCKRAEVSELVHDAHTLQRAILTPCTATMSAPGTKHCAPGRVAAEWPHTAR